MSAHDPKRFGKVAVLMGGPSAERAVSLKSGAAVLAALTGRGVDAHGIDADERLIETLRAGSFDRAFNILHGTWGEDGIVQGALELIGMPYTGSGVLASALAMDKRRSRNVLEAAGLAVPKTRVVTGAHDFEPVIEALGLPLAIKPNAQGSSIGVSKVTQHKDMPAAFNEAHALDDVVLAEAWITGAELHCAILDGIALTPVRVEAAGGFYDYAAKYESNSTQYHCPAGLDEVTDSAVRALALAAFEVLGCRDWGRVDILLDKHNTPHVLEVNTLPGMTDHSLVPMAARADGMDFDELVMRILEGSCD